MPKKGIKWYRRGEKLRIKVGFFYYELILNEVTRRSEGSSTPAIAKRTHIPFHTVLKTLRKLEEMKRVTSTEGRGKRNQRTLFWKLTKWRLK